MDANKEIDALISALYETICGPAGQERQWERMRGLFFSGAHMIRTSISADGIPQALVMGVEEYIASTSGFFQEQGFFEWEIARRLDQFGNIAHVFSTYEARHDPTDAAPFKRGINSIQLFFDGQRWWIMNMLWDNERAGNRLPGKYLSTKLDTTVSE
jgi:hypothetical protein